MDPVRVPSIAAASFPLPPRLEGLRRLAYNLHWAWHPRTRGLFNLIDRTAWTRYRNPIPVISGPTEWSRLLDDAKFLAEYHDVLAEFDAYMANGSGHWFQRRYADQLSGPIAYFCAEYGFHESLGIYSGGLGVLAGDHMKTASDMALPAIGVGLLYRKGYFRQTIDADGHQEHDYPDYDLTRLPLGRVQDASGLPLTVTVELPGRDLAVAVWLAQVGRVPVLLLDTDLPENDDADRPITNILYVRGREMRLHQELVLGIGGVRAIRALGLAPAVWHLNEGHSAFLLAERAREYVAAGTPLDDAFAAVKRDSVFTIHTPVSAGNERFEADLVRRVAGPLLDEGGVPVERVLDLGLGVDGDRAEFDMTAFSLRLTNGANAVSHLHAETANATWQGVPDSPILGITNGIHGPTWIGEPIADLLEDLGADLDDLDESTEGGRFWERLERIPGRELWDAHLRQKRELAHFARGRLRSQFARHGESPAVLAELETALDPDVLTVGFARRFATYKRAGLLFSDIDRLARMLFDEERPIQIVFAGKAHPADRPGQRVIQEIFQRVALAAAPRTRLHPRELRHAGRPLPGPGRRCLAQQSAPAARGVGHLGDEGGPERRPQHERPRRLVGRGLEGDNGWAIGDREIDPDEAAQDWRDSQDLYRLLEEQIVPAYYDRDAAGLPTRWLTVTRRAMATALWRFSTTRMLHEYTEHLYLPAAGVSVSEHATRPAVTEAG